MENEFKTALDAWEKSFDGSDNLPVKVDAVFNTANYLTAKMEYQLQRNIQTDEYFILFQVAAKIIL